MKKNNTSKKLGIYLEIDSVNWSLVDSKNNDLIDMGVFSFSPGCENFGMGKREVSKMFSKRMIRLRRVRYARVRTRKYYLLKELIVNKMCPLTMERLELWKKTKHFPEEELGDWLAMNPYKLRERGLKEMLTLEELGRIFYQISRHRGYNVGQRNSKLLESVLGKGIPADRKVGYIQTQRSVRNRNSLGQYLNDLLPKEKVSYTTQMEKIRNRICTTQMYYDEIHKIWALQARFNHRVNEKTRDLLIGSPNDLDPKGLLFFKRPLKSMKHKVGKCQFEKNKPRCSVSSLKYQELEGWKWVNSIRVNNKLLSAADAAKVFQYYQSNYRFSFIDIKGLLDMPSSKNFNYKDDQTFTGSFINSEMAKSIFFGSRWFTMGEKEQEDIYHSLYFFSSTQRLARYAENKWGLSTSSAKQFSTLRLNKNYAPLSRKACVKIIYFLKRGYIYKQAIFLAGVKNAIGDKNWDKLNDSQQQEFSQLLINLYRESPPSAIINDLENLITKTAGIKHFNPKKLYGFSQSHKESRKTFLLPKDKQADEEIKQLKNPLLVHSFFQMRKIINAIIGEYGEIDEIACELSVHLKTNRMQRFLHKIGKNKKKNNYESYQADLVNLGENLIPNNFLKYDLWVESKQTCPFSGKEIPLELLFTSNVQVVYIHPWSRSLNDNNLNKTICVSEIAEQLNERAPYEYFQEESPEDWEMIKSRAVKLFSNTQRHPINFRKHIRFNKKYNYRDVLKKQFNDPHQISKSVAEILAQAFNKVTMLPGNVSEKLIDEWILKNVFKSELSKFDHRVNLLRAYVSAVSSKEHILALALKNKYNRATSRSIVPIPNPRYLEQIEKKLNSILIAIHKNNQVISKRRFSSQLVNGKKNISVKSIRGSLHKDTLYAKRKPPMLQESLHIRRPLAIIKTTNQLSKVVDDKIREIIIKKIQWKGKEKDQVPIEKIMGYSIDGKPIPKIFLPNKNGDKVPVYKVRMRENFSTSVQLKKNLNGYVVPRNNHHILIYKNNKNQYKEEVTTFWEVVNRYRKGEAIYRSFKPNKGEVIAHLHINDLFLLGLNEEKSELHLLPEFVLRKHLYRVQKLSSKYYEFRIAYKKFNVSNEFPEYIRINNFGDKKTGWKTHNPIKVKVSLIGKLEII